MKKYNSNDLNGQGYYTDEKHIMMYAAIMFNDPAKVSELIRDGAELNLARNDTHEPPLVYAIKEKHQAIVNLFLENGADPNINDEYTVNVGKFSKICFTKPLITAIKLRNLYAIESLLKHGANPHTCDEFGIPALLATITDTRVGTPDDTIKVMQLLVNAGADVNHAKEDGFTAMMGAVIAKNEMAVDFLLENGGVLGSSNIFKRENFSDVDNIQHELVAKIEAHALMKSANQDINPGLPTEVKPIKKIRL